MAVLVRSKTTHMTSEVFEYRMWRTFDTQLLQYPVITMEIVDIMYGTPLLWLWPLHMAVSIHINTMVKIQNLQNATHYMTNVNNECTQHLISCATKYSVLPNTIILNALIPLRNTDLST